MGNQNTTLGMSGPENPQNLFHYFVWSLCQRWSRGFLAGDSPGQRQYPMPLVLVLLVGINSNKRQQITAKAGDNLFVERNILT